MPLTKAALAPNAAAAIGKIKIPEWRAMVTEIALALDEAATAALEQAAQRAKKLTRWILSDQVDGCDIVSDDDGNYLLYEDVIAAIEDDSEHGNRD